MKKSLYIFFSVICLYSVVSQSTNAQTIPKVEKVNILATSLIVKDSLFLRGLDSLIFNSICPEIKNPSGKLKIFNVYSKKNDKRDNSYTLNINLNNTINIYNEKDFKGCFDYNGYLFLWFYDIPKNLFSLSNQKRKLTYIKGVPVSGDFASFVFDYTDEKLTLTGICCY